MSIVTGRKPLTCARIVSCLARDGRHSDQFEAHSLVLITLLSLYFAGELGSTTMDAGNSAFQVFSEEWKHICESNPDELRRGDLQRLHQMFAVLMGEEKPKYDLPLVQRPYSFYMPKLTAK